MIPQGREGRQSRGAPACACEALSAEVCQFILEIALLSGLSHPNVVRFWRGGAAGEGTGDSWGGESGHGSVPISEG